MLFTKTRQYNLHIFDKIIFFKYRTIQLKATIANNKVTCLFDTSSLTCFRSIFVMIVLHFYLDQMQKPF